MLVFVSLKQGSPDLIGFLDFLEIRNVAEKTYSNDEEYIEILVLFNQMELESHVWQAATEISS